jgi:alkanesulfonate monooxygenase SsuD/methylene tetrahydromethanopterin reductase-like flavin-dependent oxidoreductase (luciferase family)
MDFGIAVATSTQSWRAVKRAEELGFSHAWFYDTQLLNPDVFIGMTQAAMNTQRIRLGTGVLIPSNRIEPVTANALATLNAIAPGRIDFGVGTGFTGRRTMGLGAISLARLESYVNRVQGLLRGETVSWDFEGIPRAIRFLNPDFGLINLDDPIPLHVSAFGPRARQLTAKLGAGWLNFGADVNRAVKELAEMRDAWREAGRDEPLYSTQFALGCVLRAGEAADSPRAIAQAGPLVAVLFHNLVETTSAGAMAAVLPAPVNAALEKYRGIYKSYEPADARYLQNHRGHLMFVRPEERELLSAELIEGFSLTGTADVLVERLRTLEAAGYSQFTIQVVEGQEDALEDWAAVFERV